jgi:uncharacterized membrane protein
MTNNDLIAMAQAIVALGAAALLYWRPRAFLPILGAGALLWIAALILIGGEDWRTHAEYLLWFAGFAFVIRVWIWVYESRRR